MIEKRVTIADDTITITGNRVVWREQIVYVEDGVEQEPTFRHRELGPNDDLGEETDRIKEIARAARIA